MVPTLSACSVHDFISEVLKLVLSTLHSFGKCVLFIFCQYFLVNGLIWDKVVWGNGWFFAQVGF